MQNGAKVARFMDLLTGRKNRSHLVMVQGAGIVDVHSTQLL